MPPLTPEQREQRRSWLEQEFKVDTYFLLRTFDHFNLDSRRIIARAMADEVYRSMEARTGSFAAWDDASRRFGMDLVAIEIMSTVFMALEDFGKLLLITKSPTKTCGSCADSASPENARGSRKQRQHDDWGSSRLTSGSPNKVSGASTSWSSGSSPTSTAFRSRSSTSNVDGRVMVVRSKQCSASPTIAGKTCFCGFSATLTAGTFQVNDSVPRRSGPWATKV